MGHIHLFTCPLLLNKTGPVTPTIMDSIKVTNRLSLLLLMHFARGYSASSYMTRTEFYSLTEVPFAPDGPSGPRCPC